MKKRQFKKELKKIWRKYSRFLFVINPRDRKKYIEFLKQEDRKKAIERMKEFTIPLRFWFNINDDSFAILKTVAV